MRTGRGVLMCWFVVTACANEDVVLFEFRGGGAAGASGMQSASGTGGTANGGSAASTDVSTAGAADIAAGDVTGAPSPPPSCRSNGDCPYGWSCEKLNCTDVTGSCIARPVCSDQT
ncbi:MAG TPA: hypothetical protein VLJ38_19640, partial [Polyangiaceae bacterium]|nr:hypothetical protein [Polyangiaceae bacterium]